jgi:hypothetical protein
LHTLRWNFDERLNSVFSACLDIRQITTRKEILGELIRWSSPREGVARQLRPLSMSCSAEFWHSSGVDAQRSGRATVMSALPGVPRDAASQVTRAATSRRS